MSMNSKRALTLMLIGILSFIIYASSSRKHASSAAALETKSNQIQWIKNEAAALTLSKKQKKPLFIDFRADWCLPCLQMEQSTYLDQDLIKLLNQDFISLQIDLTESSTESKKMMLKYGVSALPKIIFLSPEGEQLTAHTLHGYVKTPEFIKTLQSILAGSRP